MEETERERERGGGLDRGRACIERIFEGRDREWGKESGSGGERDTGG